MQEDGAAAIELPNRGLPTLPAMVAYERPRRDIGFHFVDQVAREAKAVAGIEAITAHSYTVRSTINPQLQRAVEAALQEGLSRYERSHGRVQFRGAEANLSQAIKRIEADTKSGDTRPAWQRALASARLPLYDVHWTPALVLEKPSGKKGEAWRVGLADGRILPLAIDNAAAQRKLVLNDVVSRPRGRGQGQDRDAGGAARAAGGAGDRGRAGEQERPRARHDRRLFLSAEPAQSCDPGGAPAGLRHQAAELSGGAGQGAAAQYAGAGRSDHAAADRRRPRSPAGLLDAEQLRRRLGRYADLASCTRKFAQSRHRPFARRWHRKQAGSQSQSSVRACARSADLSRMHALLSVRARRPASAADRSGRVLRGDRERRPAPRTPRRRRHRARRRDHLSP